MKGYYDDSDKYEALCKRIGVEPLGDKFGGGAYGPHESWCRLVEKGEQDKDSWEEYYDIHLVKVKHREIKNLENKIADIQEEIKVLKGK